MANELDELMDKDPLSLTTDDLAGIVAYHRRQRLVISKGEKLTSSGEAAKPAIDLAALGLIKPLTEANLKRRV